MTTASTVRVYYCTNEVRSRIADLPLNGLLQQGAKTLTPSEFRYLKDRLSRNQCARIDGPDCWFEYEAVSVAAA